MASLDLHPEDIKAKIRKRGETLASLGARAGLSRQIMALALVRPYESAEKVIAAFLREPAHKIWPSRYHSNGRRKSPQDTASYTATARFRNVRGAAL